MRFLFITRCLTCNVKLPKVGDEGDLGLPSASRTGGGEFDTTFGAIYEGMSAANLMNRAMDKYLQTLQRHRGHKLERRIKQAPDEDPDRIRPWRQTNEARPSPDFAKGYANGRYSAACERCGKSFVASRQELRQFTPTILSAARIRKFFDDCVASGLENSAAPLSARERDKLATFLTHHRSHGVRVALLTGAADRASRPRRKRPAVAAGTAHGPLRDLDDWWARLETSGWLEEVGKSEATRIREAAAAFSATPLQAFHALSPAGFDAESIENSGDYGRLILSSYRKAASGLFKPVKVRDHIDRSNSTVVISFEAGGRKFSREFSQDSDYVADGVHEFLNDALAELGIERRFHLLPSADQTAEIVCVSPATYQRALEAGIIPDRAPA